MKKLTRRQLRRMILNEMSSFDLERDMLAARSTQYPSDQNFGGDPDRRDHIRGIRNKMHALKGELGSRERAAARGDISAASMEQLASIRRKLDRLEQELDHLVDDGSPAAY
jgi:hypothetical protein